MVNKKCVYTIAIDNWFPEMCKITFPLIKAWANKISADFFIIDKPVFNGYPPNYEKFQIWEKGQNYDWNIYIDADMIVNPVKMPDFIEHTDPTLVYYESLLHPSQHYKKHPYFSRHGIDLGLSDCFIVSSSFTHDLWQPLLPFEELRKYCNSDREVSEFNLNLNIARYGLKLATKMGYDHNHFHLQTTDDYSREHGEYAGPKIFTKEQHVERALQKIKEMGISTEI